MESKYIENDKERNINKDDNQDNDNKSDASRSYSNKSRFWTLKWQENIGSIVKLLCFT